VSDVESFSGTMQIQGYHPYIEFPDDQQANGVEMFLDDILYPYIYSSREYYMALIITELPSRGGKLIAKGDPRLVTGDVFDELKRHFVNWEGDFIQLGLSYKFIDLESWYDTNDYNRRTLSVA
jgi:hypothetical protein